MQQFYTNNTFYKCFEFLIKYKRLIGFLIKYKRDFENSCIDNLDAGWECEHIFHTQL